MIQKKLFQRKIQSFTNDVIIKYFSNSRIKTQNQNIITDDKVLTSWNSLMIKLLINASDILSEPKYLDHAEAALWLKKKLSTKHVI